MESTAPLLDIDFGISQLSGNRNLYITLLGKFSDEYSDLNDKLQSMMQRNEYDRAYTLIHTLKGVSANLGLTALHHASKQVEIAIRGNQRLPQDYSGFVIIVERTLAQIAALTSGSATPSQAQNENLPARTQLLAALRASEFIPQARLDSYLKALALAPNAEAALASAIDELDYQQAIAILNQHT